MWRGILLAVFSLVMLPTTRAHELHVSVCDIEIKGGKIEITFKTFIDDLQLALGLTPGEEVPSGYSSAEQMIEEYLNKHVNIYLNGKLLQLSIERADGSLDKSVWVSIKKMEIHEPVKQLVIQNHFMTELYGDQTNLVNIKYEKERSIIQFNKKKKTHEFNF